MDTARIVRIVMAMGHTSPITGPLMDHIGRRTGTRISRMDISRTGTSRGGRAERRTATADEFYSLGGGDFPGGL